MTHDKGIYGIVSGIVLLAVVTCCGIRHFVRLRSESEAYADSRPALHIASPREAVIYMVNDPHTLSDKRLPETDDKRLPLQLWDLRSSDPERPLLIARYPQGRTAIWCAVKPDEQDKTVKHIATSLCDGFTPVVETLPNGAKLLHFSTKHNEFLHLYIEGGTVGCSYDESLLTTPAADTLLYAAVKGNQRLSATGIVHYNERYRYLDMEQTDSTVTFRQRLNALPGFLDGKQRAFSSAAIASSARSVLQASCHTDSLLDGLITLAIATSDNQPPESILAIGINDESALRQRLKGCFTPNGYKASNAKLSEWLPSEWLQSEAYWLAIRKGMLFASPSHKALWQYIHDCLWNKPCVPPLECGQAALTLWTDGTIDATQWLPDEIIRLLPPAIGSEKIVMQLFITGNKCGRVEIAAPSPLNTSQPPAP